MLILIGTVPTAYALNHAVTAKQSQDFISVSHEAVETLNRYVQAASVMADPREDVTEYVRTREFKPSTVVALRELVNDMANEMSIFKLLSKVPPERTRNFRNDLYLVSEAFGSCRNPASRSLPLKCRCSEELQEAH